MKYLVTGLTGFAGCHLAKLLLEKGHEVHGVVRTANGREMDLLDVLTIEELNKIKFHYLDLKHYYGVEKLIKENNFDGVFHLAAQSHPPTSFLDPIMTWADNVGATMNLITALQGSKTRFMFCSTSEVYGDSGKDVGLLKVTTPLNPSNPYGCSKAAMDMYVQERSKNGFLDGFVTRAFSHTGARRGKIFSISSDAFQLAQMMLKNRDYIHDGKNWTKINPHENILKVGNLETERVVIDVRDCVNAYYLLMMNPLSKGKVFNVCGDEVHKMEYYTDALIKASGLEVTKSIYPPFYRPIDIQVQIGDSTELRELTGWKPVIPIEETMQWTLDYWVKKLST